MLGIILLFVGGVLLINGVGGLGLIDTRASAVLNFMTGCLALLIGVVMLVRAAAPPDYFPVACVMLFAFNYLYVAICMWLALDMRGFGWFCLFIAITTVPCALLAFDSPDPRFGVFWLVWGSLWLMYFLALVRGFEFGRLLPFATIAIGVLTCWIPGFLILVQRW
ncbi:MAG: AmiS/UreI family transporter [Gammaproteobacteria bacterium]